VGSGESGYKAVLQNCYKLIVCDARMPDISALQLLRMIKNKKPHQPLVVVTAHGSTKEAVSLLKEGALDFVELPDDMQSFDMLLDCLGPETQGVREECLCHFSREERVVYVFSCRELSTMNVKLPLLERLYNSGRLDTNEMLKLTLALQEALANSLDHGNLELLSAWRDQISEDGTDLFSAKRRERLTDPTFADRTITLEAAHDGRRLILSVKDEGAGFIGAGSQTNSGEAVCCHGRGLTIMTDAVDELKFLDNGSRVEMIKKLRRDSAERN
jgi:CheY-like chemotaxis protein